MRPCLGLLALMFIGCDEKLSQPAIVALYHPRIEASGDGGHIVPPPVCDGRCCPTAPECYPVDNANAYSAAECLAQRDNTFENHWQLRQTFSVSTTPPGIAQALVANVLVHRSELPWKDCAAASGTSGFIQLLDLDRMNDTARVGFAKYEADGPTAAAKGLCFVENTYDSDWHLNELYTVPSAWPKGLPPPMPMPWHVKPALSSRYKNASGQYVDFDVESQRAELLAHFDQHSGDLYGKFDGLFYLDQEHGYVHGYAPLTYIVNYDDATSFTAIPIREAEMKMQVNDPKHPNCAGSFLGDNPNLPATCTGDATNRAWGCFPGNCSGLAPTIIEGYFLVAELEQIYNSILLQTLCHLFPGAAGYAGWNMDATSCRSDATRWNPTDPINGLPPGDWCAATNSKASDTCHDAWKSVSYSTFQGFPIQPGTCAAL